MIHSLTSTLPSFKTLRFKPGFNVLLARQRPGATERDTRNGVGKSSFVELVHFLLGADARPQDVLRGEQLEPHTWTLRLSIGDHEVGVERSPKPRSKLLIHGGGGLSWPIPPVVDLGSGQKTLSLEDWKLCLGAWMFRLPLAEEGVKRDAPTFRGVFSWFARRVRDGGFHEPTRFGTKQQPGDAQVALSWLLGLDARIPSEQQRLKKQEQALKELKRFLKDGALGEVIEEPAALQAQVTLAEAELERARDRVGSFRVIEGYRELEREASELTRRIRALSEEDTLDRQYIAHLNETLEREIDPVPVQVERVFKEAGLVLPEHVTRRYHEVEVFHRSIIANRRHHLSSEVSAAEHRIQERLKTKTRLDDRRAELMKILQQGGALEHFTELQAEVSRKAAQLERLRARLKAAHDLQSQGAEFALEHARLYNQLLADHAERKALIDEAVMTFASLSSALYEREGLLVINPTQTGLKVETRIDGEQSRGIAQMQIFCFDMTLAILQARRGQGPGFLIHDSHLFDGVDTRQVAGALKLGARWAAEAGFQYIVTLNDDAIPWSLLEGELELGAYILEPQLTDAREDGGLFGLRFG